eukprot:scaffold249310_cov109-Cyclotella_meneghiniana.AAC.1
MASGSSPSIRDVIDKVGQHFPYCLRIQPLDLRPVPNKCFRVCGVVRLFRVRQLLPVVSFAWFQVRLGIVAVVHRLVLPVLEWRAIGVGERVCFRLSGACSRVWFSLCFSGGGFTASQGSSNGFRVGFVSVCNGILGSGYNLKDIFGQHAIPDDV